MTQTSHRQINQSILAVGLLTFIGILIETSMNVTFPTLMEQFQQPLEIVQWTATGYLLVVTLIMATSAFLLKRFSSKQLFLTGVVSAVIGAALCLVAPTFHLLLLGRMIQAVSTGLVTPLLFSIIFEKIPVEHWGSYMGVASMIIALAPALGPTYGGLMSVHFSWRAIFIGSIILTVICFFIGFKVIPNEPGDKTLKFDSWGYVQLVGFLVVFLFAVQELTSNLLVALGLLILALGLLYLFIRRQLGNSTKLIDISILKDRSLSWLFANYFSLQFVNIGLAFLIPLFAQNVLKADALASGMILLPGSVLSSAFAPMVGAWYDRVGIYFPTMVGNLMVFAGLILFASFSGSMTLTLMTISFLILRLGFSIVFGNLMTEGGKRVDPSKKDDQNSLFNLSQQYAGSVATGLLAVIITLTQDFLQSSYESAVLEGARFSFLFLAVLVVIVWIGNARSLKQN